MDFRQQGSFPWRNSYSEDFMESLFFKMILEKLIDGIMILIITGGIVAATSDLQKKAAEQKHIGLISMLKINRQLTQGTHRRLWLSTF
jgi:hypothetical protein